MSKNSKSTINSNSSLFRLLKKYRLKKILPLFIFCIRLNTYVNILIACKILAWVWPFCLSGFLSNAIKIAKVFFCSWLFHGTLFAGDPYWKKTMKSKINLKTRNIMGVVFKVINHVLQVNIFEKWIIYCLHNIHFPTLFKSILIFLL